MHAFLGDLRVVGLLEKDAYFGIRQAQLPVDILAAGCDVLGSSGAAARRRARR
jgi:hypothetical protein